MKGDNASKAAKNKANSKPTQIQIPGFAGLVKD